MSDIMPGGTVPRNDWSDQDYEIFETWIRGVLHTEKVEVTFTKADGEERVMRCTLNPDLIPPAPVLTEDAPKRTKAATPLVISVYDLDKNGWRSFRVKSVRSFKFTLGDVDE